MRKRRAKHPSLESELKRLASQRIKKDPRGRTRAELLAATLWNKSLSGDRDSLRMLLERLPTAQPEAEPSASATTSNEPSNFDQITAAFKAMVQAGIVPAEVFSQYRIKQFEQQFEDGNPNLTKTIQ